MIRTRTVSPMAQTVRAQGEAARGVLLPSCGKATTSRAWWTNTTGLQHSGAAPLSPGRVGAFYLRPRRSRHSPQIADMARRSTSTTACERLTDSSSARAEPWGITRPRTLRSAPVTWSAELGARPAAGSRPCVRRRGDYVGIRGSCIRVAPHLTTPRPPWIDIEALQTIAS